MINREDQFYAWLETKCWGEVTILGAEYTALEVFDLIHDELGIKYSREWAEFNRIFAED